MIRKTILILSLTIPFYSSFSQISDNTCEGSENIDEYRAKKYESDKRFQTELSYKNLFLDTFSKSELKKDRSERKFHRCIKRVVGKISTLRASDDDLILRELRNQDVLKMSKEDQLQAILDLYKSDSFYKYFEQFRKDWSNVYSRYAFSGSATESYRALFNVTNPEEANNEKKAINLYKAKGIDTLKAEANPLDYLSKHVSLPVETFSYRKRKANFSPGIAKIILFELLRARAISEKYSEYDIHAFNNFAAKLKLGVILPDSELTSQGEDEKFKKNKNYKYLLSDGYFLGAKTHDMKFSSTKRPVSFDCTTLVQYCAFGSNSFDETFKREDIRSKKLKIITSDFFVWANNSSIKKDDSRRKLALNKLSRKFNIREFESETQLVPGDIIVYKGHIIIFKGYELDIETGKYLFKTIEAEGKFSRSVNEFSRDIYRESEENTSTCSKTQWSSKDTDEKKAKAYIVRFK